jgi:transcriptional regulator with XRE-family HTH domain
MPIYPQRTFELADSAVGEVLRAARRKANLDQRVAAEVAGIDWRVLSRIERGERPCRVTELVALAGTYRFTPERLLRAITGDVKVRARLKLDDDEPATTK